MAMQKMNIKQFMEIYCQDILEQAKIKKEFVSEDIFTYDRIKLTEDGARVKIVDSAAGDEIDIEDIITLDEEQFSKAYPGQAALDTYRAYINNFIIIEGEQMLEVIRNQILKSKERIDKYSSIRDDDTEWSF